MAANLMFRYFPEYEKWARFTNEDCVCPNESRCLDGLCFDNPSVPEAVCLNDLVSGRFRVDIPDYLLVDLAKSVNHNYPDWPEDQAKAYSEHTVDELSRTPPVQWIQSNQWPVCHADFCRYLGEWDQSQLARNAPDGDGLTYLMSIVQDPVHDKEGLWQSIDKKWTIIFMFECFTCSRVIAIDQSF